MWPTEHKVLLSGNSQEKALLLPVLGDREAELWQCCMGFTDRSHKGASKRLSREFLLPEWDTNSNSNTNQMKTAVQSTTNCGSYAFTLRFPSSPSTNKTLRSHIAYIYVFPNAILQMWHLQEEDLPKLNPVFTSVDQVKDMGNDCGYALKKKHRTKF